MKRKILFLLFVLCLLISCLGACNAETRQPGSGKIYLYGEQHSVNSIMSQELELWSDYYHNHDMRHLFIEFPNYFAEYLNLWMKADNDDILNALYKDIKGTAGGNPLFLAFYKRIKKDYPETIFHGTDVGHQYNTTGKRFLEYLEEAGQQDTELYRLSKETVEQGEHFYGLMVSDQQEASQYREKLMAENFIREFDSLNGTEDIMGIYGSTHASIDMPSCMANALHQKYGDALTSLLLVKDPDRTDLLPVEEPAKELTEPIRTDTMKVGGKEYTASYFGKEDLPNLASYGYGYVEYWRLEDAYKDFRSKPASGSVKACFEYPMEIEKGQVFLLRYTMLNGTTADVYYRSDGTYDRDFLTTRHFTPE